MIGTGTFLQQRYRIDKQIGQGGMGAVYVAMDERFGSTVAIKETLCMDENFRKALEREARLLNSLKHSALPRVSDHFLEDDGQFLVMEFVPGLDLMQTLESGSGPFPWEQVLDWADQLLDALDYLHNQENPVVHRDIKPQNLKVTSKGQVVLLDFGLAKGNVTDAGNKTAAKSIFGYSRNYASLEQIQGTGTDPRSDLYSLAATLYHLMTGVPPEDALTRAMAVLSHQPDPLVPASTINPAIPAGVSFILQNSMDLSAGRRPASAAEMRERLRNHPAYSNQTSPNLPVASFPTEGSVFGSPTLAIQDSTFVPHAVGSEAVTELLTDNRSQVTSIRDARSNGERVALSAAPAVDGNSKSKLRYLFAGIFAVLMVCAGSLGLYLNREQLFNEPAAVEEGPAAAPDTTQAISEPVDSDQSSEDTETDAPAADGSAGSAQERRAVAPKAQPNAAKRESNRAHADDDDDVVINGDSIKAGNVMIDKGGRVTSKGSNFNFNMMPPNFPVPPIQIDPRLLTPEQRRKLRIFRQNNPLPANRPRPTPYD